MEVSKKGSFQHTALQKVLKRLIQGEQSDRYKSLNNSYSSIKPICLDFETGGAKAEVNIEIIFAEVQAHVKAIAQ